MLHHYFEVIREPVSKNFTKHARSRRLSPCIGLTALALFLGVEKTTCAFRSGPYFSNFLQRRYYSISLLATKDGAFDDFDIDTSKLPRLFVGNPERSCRVTPEQGLLKALHHRADFASPLKSDGVVLLNEEQSHYLNTVLRLGKKSKAVPFVRLFDENGEEWLAKVSVPESGRPRNQILSAVCTKRLRCEQPSSSQSSCWLVVAPTKKKDRIRWMIEKCTELNVSGFILLDTEFSEPPSISLKKMQLYAIEAAEQSERLSVPLFVLIGEESSEITRLDDFIAAWRSDSEGISLGICRERSSEAVPIFEYLHDRRESENEGIVAFLVGPEGGWSRTESTLFDGLIADYAKAIQPISLGSTVLRSETACMLSVGAFALLPEAVQS